MFMNNQYKEVLEETVVLKLGKEIMDIILLLIQFHLLTKIHMLIDRCSLLEETNNKWWIEEINLSK